MVLEGNQNCIIDPKVTVIFLNGLILPIGGVALGFTYKVLFSIDILLKLLVFKG